MFTVCSSVFMVVGLAVAVVDDGDVVLVEFPMRGKPNGKKVKA